MKIIVDERVDYFFVTELRLLHFTVTSIIEEFASATDEDTLSMLLMPPALIITEENDF
ncbi:hypothetical protein [Ilyomonas limi]|jgi:hypothetical protein|uniref:hypothetical protein n=1 Tax=Ilyomonas limi TaxID=2575867 RepID=UPI001485C1EA|nr:hypothetical protein [Ilyomonas limi]